MAHAQGEHIIQISALLELWLEVVDEVYEAKWYILLFDQRNGIACLDVDAYGMMYDSG